MMREEPSQLRVQCPHLAAASTVNPWTHSKGAAAMKPSPTVWGQVPRSPSATSLFPCPWDINLRRRCAVATTNRIPPPLSHVSLGPQIQRRYTMLIFQPT